jgi:hypothetical protein
VAIAGTSLHELEAHAHLFGCRASSKVPSVA